MNMSNASSENQIAQPAMVQGCQRCKELEAEVRQLRTELAEAVKATGGNDDNR